MLLDCGEGTLHQMITMYGRERTNMILAQTKAIFVSHLHFDHHGGWPTLLKRYAKFKDDNEEVYKDAVDVCDNEEVKKVDNKYGDDGDEDADEEEDDTDEDAYCVDDEDDYHLAYN
ncbi:hypothetical protein DPMN_156901 [Dreissena polymorpha]|uniref:ribonuclease Z n=1 Tax=Dreissena polymorpha TaxID=45954 RepID=A0A9D4FQP0_DREPO|nr:hypothetical protein DPMN_156901 [Dreissena polymorpha]